jgi:chitodextrinase
MKNYDVSRDGGATVYTTVTHPTTSVTITGATPSTGYPCCVRARDNAGNVSAWSPVVVVTTAASGGDTTAPTVPTGLAHSGVTQTGATVSWTGSTDAVGVTKYQVRVNGVTLGDESTSTSRALTGLTAGTAQSWDVRAGDAAGNWSAWATADTFNTLPSGGGGGATPAAAYGFNEGSGTTAADAIGSRTLTGLAPSASWAAAGHTGSALAKSGGAVIVPNSAGLQTASRTLMFWAKPTATSDGWWVQFYIASLDTAAFAIGRIGGQLYCRCRIGSSNTNLTTSPLAVGTYAHVAITYDGTTFRAYLNGTQFSSQALTGTIATADDARIFDPGSAVEPDDLRFYTTALDATAIQAAMNTPV